MSVLGPDFEQEANKQKVERCRDWLERRGFFVLPDLEWAPQVNHDAIRMGSSHSVFLVHGR